MEIRRRTSKSVARRHDLNYFKKGSPLRRWQGLLTLAALACSLLWLGSSFAFRGSQLLSSGPVSSSHAVFGANCQACHLPVKGTLFHRAGFRRDVPDSACLACHNVPAHQARQTFTPRCSSCHTEHTGSMLLAHTADANCTQCHRSLRVQSGTAHFVTAVGSFPARHPEFAPLRSGFRFDPAIKFAHAAHMKRGLLGPHGPITMACDDCHRAASDSTAPWPYGSFQPASLAGSAMPGPTPAGELSRDHGRAYLAPVTYAATCHDCHTLRFDSRIAAEAPHADPARVRAFIALSIRTWAAQHPDAVASEIRSWTSDTRQRVPRVTLTVVPHNAAEWITIRTAQAEERIWRESCNLCHQEQIPEIPASSTSQEISAALTNPATLPVLASTHQPERWLTHAVFSHQAHQSVGCVECHTRAASSQNASDILLPSISACRRCHDGQSRPQGPALAAGHAESGCFLCHKYHNWNEPGLMPPSSRSLSEAGVIVPAK